MTLVVTSVSKNGVTVVGDKAASWPHGQQTASSPSATKVFVSEAARISVALWGSARWPGGGYESWVASYVQGLDRGHDLGRAAQDFASQANLRLAGGDSDEDRRGAHFAGFVGETPHLYHVHTGVEGEPQHELRVFRDYPDVHCGSVEEYRQVLASGGIIMLRNGRYDLHELVGGARLQAIQRDFEKQYGSQLPAPSLEGELLLSAALVRFAAGLVIAAGAVPTVSEQVDGFAFSASGRFLSLSSFPEVRIGDRLSLRDVRGADTHSLSN